MQSARARRGRIFTEVRLGSREIGAQLIIGSCARGLRNAHLSLGEEVHFESTGIYEKLGRLHGRRAEDDVDEVPPPNF